MSFIYSSRRRFDRSYYHIEIENDNSYDTTESSNSPPQGKHLGNAVVGDRLSKGDQDQAEKAAQGVMGLGGDDDSVRDMMDKEDTRATAPDTENRDEGKDEMEVLDGSSNAASEPDEINNVQETLGKSGWISASFGLLTNSV